MLQKQASIDLKISKIRWRMGLRPRPHWGAYDALRPPNRKGHRAFAARHSLFFVYFKISISLPGPLLTVFLDPPLRIVTRNRQRAKLQAILIGT